MEMCLVRLVRRDLIFYHPKGQGQGQNFLPSSYSLSRCALKETRVSDDSLRKSLLISARLMSNNLFYGKVLSLALQR